jgi:hypothetical protein
MWSPAGNRASAPVTPRAAQASASSPRSGTMRGSPSGVRVYSAYLLEAMLTHQSGRRSLAAGLGKHEQVT